MELSCSNIGIYPSIRIRFERKFMEIIGTIIVLVALSAIVGMRLASSRSSTLVLQEFNVDRLPSRRTRKEVEIVGRLQGIIAFCLSLLGFSPITRFFIAGSELRCESSSLFGQRLQFIPLRSVSNVSAGVHKPFAALVFAGLLPFFGVYLLVVTESWIGVGLCLLGSAILILVRYTARAGHRLGYYSSPTSSRVYRLMLNALCPLSRSFAIWSLNPTSCRFKTQWITSVLRSLNRQQNGCLSPPPNSRASSFNRRHFQTMIWRRKSCLLKPGTYHRKERPI